MLQATLKNNVRRSFTGTVSNQPPSATVNASLNAGVITGSYTYSDGQSDLEENQKPVVRNAYITGDLRQGQTLTANYTYFSLHGYAFASVNYQWYRADNKGGEFNINNPLTLIGGATNSTYVLQAADVGKYIFCRIQVTQTGGGNTSSEYVYCYTQKIYSNAFTPTEIPFAIALLPANMSDNGTTFTWTNSGTKGGSLTATGTARPSIVGSKADFVTDDRITGNILPLSTGRYEIWIRVRRDTITSQQRPYVLGSDSKSMLNTTGTPKKVRFSSTTQNDTSGTPALDNTERIYRVIFNGVGGATIQVDKNLVNDTYYINESFTGQNNTGLVENQTLVLGSNLAGSGSFLDGTIDHFYIYPNGELTAIEADFMWEYIQNN
jgi:hypothetical protein